MEVGGGWGDGSVIRALVWALIWVAFGSSEPTVNCMQGLWEVGKVHARSMGDRKWRLEGLQKLTLH